MMSLYFPENLNIILLIAFTAFINSTHNERYFRSKIKGALLGLKHFLATENPLKMMKNAFYFTLKALFVLKIFKFLS